MERVINDIVREIQESEGATKYLCSSCGWEIINAKWWDIAKDYTGQYLCDDCEFTLIISEREGN
jgi:predicted RNA-binding Zn-ribbon protein involved in translation (DUF1610 family)